MRDLTPAPPPGPNKLLLGLVGALFLLLVIGLVGLGYVLTGRQAALAPTPTVAAMASPTFIAATPVPTPTRPPTPVLVLVTQPSPTAIATPGTEASPTPTPASDSQMPRTGWGTAWLPVALGLAALLLAARVLRLGTRS